jgi:transcription initiation factor TFIIH subunit 2
MRPTRFDLTLEYAREFVTEWFDQNPLGQIGIVGMRGGIGERICEMSGACPYSLSFHSPWFIYLFLELYIGNPQDVLHAISERHKLEPAGEPSLQNAIEMARSSMRLCRSYSFLVSIHVLLTDAVPEPGRTSFGR